MPNPYTPISSVPDCPLNFLQYLNGVYYYEVGQCLSGPPYPVTGWITSMIPLTTGCSAGACNGNPAALLAATAAAGSFIDLAALLAGNNPGGGRSGDRVTPPGRDKKAKARSKAFVANFNARADKARHRDVKTGTAAMAPNWFEQAIDDGDADAVDWGKARKEFLTGFAEVDTPFPAFPLTYDDGDGFPAIPKTVTQRFRSVDQSPQEDYIDSVSKPEFNAAIANEPEAFGEGAGFGFIPATDGRSTYRRFFRLFTTLLKLDSSVKRAASTLYFGQETLERMIPDPAAAVELRLTDRHRFSHVATHGNGMATKHFILSTVEELVPPSDFV